MANFNNKYNNSNNKNNDIDNIIKITEREPIVPYGFIPPSSFVLYPSWGYDVSQDVPFEDSLTGRIDFTIENNTALCIGGNENEKATNSKPGTIKFIRNPNGVPFIPGSTIKGALRNVLSIVSFGKLTQLDPVKISERRFENAKNVYFNKIKENHKKFDEYRIINEKTGEEIPVELFSHPGWLKKENESWVFRKCEGGTQGLEKINNSSIRTKLALTEFSNKPEENAVVHYEKLSQKGITLNNEINFQVCPEHKSDKQKRRVNICDGISNKGYIVCCNYRLESGSNVDYSYLFLKPSLEEKEKYNVHLKVYSYFAQANTLDKDKQKDDDLLEYLLDHPNDEYGIPVFAFINNANEVTQLGLCRMPRLLADKNVKEIITDFQGEISNSQPIYDLSDIMFGCIDKKSNTCNYSLKGRLNFDDALLENSNNVTLKTSNPIILNTPKISFSPTYLQNSRSYLEKRVEIAGWKRYQVRDKFVDEDFIPKIKKDNCKIQNSIEYIPEQNKFKGTIVFNNLREIELAALLWCIKLGDKSNTDLKNKSDQHFHNIGMAKPYGAGCVRFNISNISFASYLNKDIKKDKLNEYIDSKLDEFEKFMNNLYQNCFNNKPWKSSIQINKFDNLTKIKKFSIKQGTNLIKIYNELELNPSDVAEKLNLPPQKVKKYLNEFSNIRKLNENKIINDIKNDTPSQQQIWVPIDQTGSIDNFFTLKNNLDISDKCDKKLSDEIKKFTDPINLQKIETTKNNELERINKEKQEEEKIKIQQEKERQKKEDEQKIMSTMSPFEKSVFELHKKLADPSDKKKLKDDIESKKQLRDLILQYGNSNKSIEGKILLKYFTGVDPNQIINKKKNGAKEIHDAFKNLKEKNQN